MGDIVFVDVDTLDEDLDKEETFGSIEAVKTVSDLFMPVAGEVIEFNEGIEEESELVNSDPYGTGWIVKVKMRNADDFASLLSADEYQALVA